MWMMMREWWWVNDIQKTQWLCDIYLMPVAASIFGPLSQTRFCKRVFMNEISISALLDIQLILLCVCGVDLFLSETSSAEKYFPDQITWIPWKTKQNLLIWPFLNSRLEMWVWESGRKIDPTTGVNRDQCFSRGTRMRSQRRMKTWTSYNIRDHNLYLWKPKWMESLETRYYYCFWSECFGVSRKIGRKWYFYTQNSAHRKTVLGG